MHWLDLAKKNWIKKIIIFLAVFQSVFFAWYFLSPASATKIVILNPEFHPVTGGNWTVFFETKGTSSLEVLLNDLPTQQDMAFSYLACQGNKIKNVKSNFGKVLADNWSCDGQGAIIFKVKKLGNHELKFRFGDKIAFAHNSSQTTYDLSVSSSVSRMAYEGKDAYNAIPVNTASSSWSTAGTQFTTAMYTSANSSNDTYASTTDTSSSTFKQIVHEFYIKINEATTTVTQVDYYWEGRSAQAEELASDNDLRMYVYDFSGAAWRAASSSLDGGCNSSDCIFTHTTTTNVSNFFDRNKGVRFIVQKYEAGHNCSSSPDTITCGKKAATTPPSGCTNQSNSEDLWSQCATSDYGGCGTGNCYGSSFVCGAYFDSAQHDTCTGQCFACNGGCVPSDTTGGSNQLGCTGQCYKCTSGSCESSSCEGQQCGCSAGQLCQSGTCVTQLPDTCVIACQAMGRATGWCYPKGMQGTCASQGRLVDGNAQDCVAPSFCCCSNP